MKLLIFVRKGCCICENLKENLVNIDISSIIKNLKVEEIDIDRFDLYQDRFKKYDYLVPVLALKYENSYEIIELPRVSPRLKKIQLKNWLKKNIDNVLQR